MPPVTVENIPENELNTSIVELPTTPPRKFAKQTRRIPVATDDKVPESILIEVYTDPISNVQKKPIHPSLKELFAMTDAPPKYFHIHLTDKKSSDRLHVWAVKYDDETKYAVSNFTRGTLLEHNELLDPRKYIEDFIASHAVFKGGMRRHRSRSSRGGYKPTPRDLAALRKWRAGKSIGFTMRSSLKAKGLIPRANGTRRISPKYQ